MPSLSDRANVFRASIAEFIDLRRDAKLKGEDDPEVAARYAYDTWLADAARRVSQIQAVTHVLKATHPNARGTSLHVNPETLPQHGEIGTHSLGSSYAVDVVGNAAVADIYALLKREMFGKKLLDWMQVGDADLTQALSDDSDIAQNWMQSFAALIRNESKPVSHPTAKQIYWLVGEDTGDDAHYQLLQPLFSSTLAHAVHAEIQDARFGERNKLARGAHHAKEPCDSPYVRYLDLLELHLGAPPKPTNKQKHLNISHLNADRLGRNYLLASLPPTWESGRPKALLKISSAFDRFSYFEGVRRRLRALAEFLRPDPPPNIETRNRRRELEQDLGLQLLAFADSIKADFEPGWTRDEDCQLPLCEQLWLDPERIELPLREGREDADQDFIDAYHFADWPDEVAGRFANWFNGRLREAGLVTVGDAEFKHWGKQAIVDAQWPVPMQRRAGART